MKVKLFFKYVGIFFLVVNKYINVFSFELISVIFGLIFIKIGINMVVLNIVNKCCKFNLI